MSQSLDEHTMKYARIRYSIPANPQLVGTIRRTDPIRIEDVFYDSFACRHYMRYGVKREWISVGSIVSNKIYIGDESFDFYPIVDK